MHVFLADFGLSKIMSDCDLVGSTTMRAGTPGFQAPEQLQGKSISSKCDVYAFGGVLTELFGEVSLWPKTPAHQIMFNVAVKGVSLQQITFKITFGKSQNPALWQLMSERMPLRF